jgi:ABC-type nitrate/sulfonate/bicarbonate transport system substrate-binding protein
MAFSVAKLAGYYQAEELDVEFVLMSAGTAVQALIGGSVADGQDGHHHGLED